MAASHSKDVWASGWTPNSKLHQWHFFQGGPGTPTFVTETVCWAGNDAPCLSPGHLDSNALGLLGRVKH